MSARLTIALAAVALAAAPAPGYIHFPPATLPKMCEISTHVRVLTVEKFDAEKGVVLFKVADTLKGPKNTFAQGKHVLTPTAAAKPVLDWLKAEKTAVMFSIEGGYGQLVGCAYVFIDENCYSADYNEPGEFWQLIRVEPGRSACYHGPVEKLKELAKETLAGKKMAVPTKEPAKKEDWDARAKEVNEVLLSNRKP